MSLYLNMVSAESGFHPNFIMIGYICKPEKDEDLNTEDTDAHYIEIAPVIDNKLHAFQPLSKTGIIDIRNQFDVEIFGPDQSSNGWITPELLYVDNSNRKTTLLYYEMPGMQQFYTADNKKYLLPKPGMVFYVKDDALRIYAFTGKEIPTQSTKLYSCPFGNTMSANRICLGSAVSVRNKKTFADTVSYWKDVYWNSKFGSITGSYVSSKYSWPKYQKAKVFDDKWLVPANLTIKSLING